MRKGLLLMVAILACFALAASAAHLTKGIPIEGSAPTVKAAPTKAPAGVVVIGPMGYADAWRTIAASQGKSIVSNSTGTDIQVLFSEYSGSASKPSDLTWTYSANGGADWNFQSIVTNRNARTYSGLAVDANFTPYVVWQDREGNTAPWPMLIAYDEGGYQAGIWKTAVHLTDSAAFYLPGMAIRDDGAGNFNLLVDGFPHAAFGYDATMYMARTTDPTLDSWNAPWDLSGTWGWKPWVDAPEDDQDAFDFTISPDGQTVVAFADQYAAAFDGYYPVYNLSTDGGDTWSGATKFTVTGADANGLPYQYNAGGWWYRYDGAWINDRPYFVYAHGDNAWNGIALFVYFPTVAGDYSAWTCKRISEIPGNLNAVTDGDLVGSYSDYATISYDASYNIFVTYVGYTEGSNATADIIGVASTDGGNTWLQHVYLTNDGATYDYQFVEAAEYAGGDYVHMITPPGVFDSLYYRKIATSVYLSAPARAREIDLAPLLCGAIGGSGGGPLGATMDTVANDSMDYIWSPAIGINGQYEVTISKTADWSADNYDYASLLDVNYFSVVGMPEAGVVWYYKVRSHFGGEVSPWSEVYDFYYNGTATNTTDWVTPSGVTGKPTVSHPFVLSQNRPNPGNGDTKISFSLPKAGDYSLKVYNVAGQVVSSISGRGQAGNNTVSWNSRNVSNGVYFYQLNAAGSTATRKMVVVK